MTKKSKNKNKRLPTKQKATTELKVRDGCKKSKNKNPQFSKSKKDLGVPNNLCPVKDSVPVVPHEVKTVEQQRIEEKLKRREALNLIRQQAREKALEEKRTKVRNLKIWPSMVGS